MNNRDIFGLGSSWSAALDIHSNLARSGVYDMIQNASAIGSIDMGHIKALDGATAMLAGTAGIIKGFEDSNYRNIIESSSKMAESMKMNYAGFFDKTNYAGLISGLTELSGALGAIRNSGILELSSSMKVWQASVKIMPNDFSDSYNSIITDSIKDLASGIEALNYNKNIYNSPVKDILSSINELSEIIEEIDIVEFTEELKEETNWQEIESITNDRIHKILQMSNPKDTSLIGIINALIGELIQYPLRDKIVASVSIKDNLVQGIMVHLIMWLISVVFRNYFSNMIATNINSNQSIKKIKRELKTLDIYDDLLYENPRLIAKDKLEVRYSNKMKSGVKDYLSFGRLVKMEHKNKNWTKISYTNIFTDEREIGWVLTRYIKRLD